MKVAALDLGSNTFLCLIAEVEHNKVTKIYSDHVEVVRLGQELELNKKFHPDALQRADQCLKKFSQIISDSGAEQVLAMATSAARDALNAEELFTIANKHNIPIEIIPGEKEASITYKGAVSGLSTQNQNLLIVDIGGGSTEYIFGVDQDLVSGESYDIGCVRLTEKFIHSQPTPQDQIEAATQFINLHIQKAKQLMPPHAVLSQIIAVAGTPTSLAAAEIGHFDAKIIEGYVFTEQKLQDWFEKLKNANIEEKIKMGIPSGRADVILIGVITLLQTLKAFGLKEINVSTRGVRHGVALEMADRYLR